MNTVTLIPNDDGDGFRVLADGNLVPGRHGEDFYNIDYECSDASAVFKLLKGLEAAGVLQIVCDPKVSETFSDELTEDQKRVIVCPGPQGVMGPAGRDGECKCEDRVAELERKVSAFYK